MEVLAVCLTSLLVLVVDEYSSAKLVEGIRICQSDCNQIIENNGTRFSSFHAHCTKLLGFQNSILSTFDSTRGKGVQNSTVNELLKTCSSAGRLIVTKRNNDLCVETKGAKIKQQNATRLLVKGSPSYAIHLKTQAVEDFYFPWGVVNSVAYMKTVSQFVLGFPDKLATSPVSCTNKTILRRGIYVNHITVDEDENIIFVTIYTKHKRYDLCTVALKGANFKCFTNISHIYMKFDIDRKYKLVFVYRESKVICFTYQGLTIDNLALNIGYIYMKAMVYNPIKDVLYFIQHQQLKMITKQGTLSTVLVVKQFKWVKSMKTQANYLYMIASSSRDKVFVVNVFRPSEFSIIKVPKTTIVYDLCLF